MITCCIKLPVSTCVHTIIDVLLSTQVKSGTCLAGCPLFPKKRKILESINSLLTPIDFSLVLFVDSAHRIMSLFNPRFLPLLPVLLFIYPMSLLAHSSVSTLSHLLLLSSSLASSLASSSSLLLFLPRCFSLHQCSHTALLI